MCTEKLDNQATIGILLAAGHSRRFGSADKLLHPLADGRNIALTAAQALMAAIPLSIAVVRANNLELQQQLQAIGMHVVMCRESQQQMADSIAAAINFSLGLNFFPTSADVTRTNSGFAGGFLIALADMPYIRTATIQRVVNALRNGAAIVVPTYQDSDKADVAKIQRGHPVGFASHFRDELSQLQGDEGARSLLMRHQADIEFLPCDDPGILKDIDTPQDLA